MRCLADFTIDSDLCLPDGVAPLRYESPDGSLSLTLSNETCAPKERAAVLSAPLLFETDKLDEETRDIACQKLAHALNFLSYTTNRKFAQHKLKRIIDWTPGITKRKAIVFKEILEWDVAEPELDRRFVHTAHRLWAMSGGETQTAALRWYRLAIQEDVLDVQFAYFWFALEIVAQALRDGSKVPSKCPRCNGALFCEECGEHPLHRPYPNQAIHQLTQRVHPDNADEIFKTLQKIRHALMHGKAIHMIEGLPCTHDEAVTKLAVVAWRAIHLLFAGDDPDPNEALSFGEVGNVQRRTMVVCLAVEAEPGGDPEHPKLDDFPEFELREVTED